MSALRDFVDLVGDAGPVAVAGGRTRWGAGGQPDDDVRVIAAPRGIVTVQPDEMTVRVYAGTPVAELHAELAAGRQRTGLPERGGTVGGALAIGEDDVAVLGSRRVRETPLQIRYVSAEGRLVTGGGPTVKNVSGYDLPRLFVGSLGTLGLLGEVLLRTDPIPAVRVWLAMDDVDPFAVTDALHGPSAVLWDRRRTWVLLEGYAPDVAEERATLERLSAVEEVAGPPPLPPHRWAVRRSALRTLDPEALGEHVVSVGVGTVFASRPQPREVPDVGSPLAALAARVKHEFDPTGRLNPGRDPARR